MKISISENKIELEGTIEDLDYLENLSIGKSIFLFIFDALKVEKNAKSTRERRTNPEFINHIATKLGTSVQVVDFIRGLYYQRGYSATKIIEFLRSYLQKAYDKNLPIKDHYSKAYNLLRKIDTNQFAHLIMRDEERY